MNIRSEFSKPRAIPNIKRQAGWTFWSLTFTLGVLAFFSYIGMQLVPIYSSNSNVVNAMERSVDGANLRTIGRAQIISAMNKQLYLDGSHKLLDYKNDLVVKRSRKSFIVQVNYQRTIPIAGNISVLTTFSPKVECNFSGSCVTSK